MSAQGFGATLKTLAGKAQIKNSVIAEYVQYDISYVSKWMSGRVVPSERNIDRIVANIARCVEEAAEKEQRNRLVADYHLSGEGELYQAVREDLLKSYWGDETAESLDNKQYCEYKVSDLMIYTAGKIELTDFAGSARQGARVIVVADLFAMEHESRLWLAGIREGHFGLAGYEGDGDRILEMVINTESMKDYIYDTIFLVHMLTSYSALSFYVYGDEQAQKRLLYADDGRAFLTAIMMDDTHSLSINHGCDADMAHQLYQQLHPLCAQEKLLFKSVSMSELIQGHIYLQSLVSSKIEWLTGHFTEQLLPEELFDELLGDKELSDGGGDAPDLGELKRVNGVLRGVLASADSKIILYKAAFTKLIISGELDFFNRRLILNNSQKLRCLRYLKELNENDNISVRIIDGNLSNDFHDLSDPCVYLADSVGYLRLENGRYSDNILLIKDHKMRKYFDRFYEEVWRNRKDIVIEEPKQVENQVNRYIAQLEMMSYGESHL